MLRKIKSYFEDWTNFELGLLIFSLFVSIASSIIFKGTIINTLYTSLYLITALLTSKGKVECYFVGLFGVLFYAIVSYNQGYYGELIITIFLTLPIMVLGIISWLRHCDKDDTVIISTLSKKEIIIVLLSQVILFYPYYLLLKFFNTDQLIISSISIVTSVIASYFEARRSELSPFCYVANDLVVTTLWLMPIINGQVELISVLVGPILLLINDTYGSYNWKRLKRKQKEKRKRKNIYCL